MYEVFLDSQGEGTNKQLSFYERMKIDELIRRYREDQELENISKRVEKTISGANSKNISEEGSEFYEGNMALTYGELSPKLF